MPTVLGAIENANQPDGGDKHAFWFDLERNDNKAWKKQHRASLAWIRKVVHIFTQTSHLSALGRHVKQRAQCPVRRHAGCQRITVMADYNEKLLNLIGLQ